MKRPVSPCWRFCRRFAENRVALVAFMVVLGGEELTAMAPEQLRRVRGRRISMVFQDPITSPQ